MAPITTLSRPRDRSRPAVKVRSTAAVKLTPPPPLDPPCEAHTSVQPPTGMELLPVTWTPPAQPTATRIPPRVIGSAAPSALVAAQKFVGTCVEILNGYRPSSHLRPLTHPKQLTTVTDQLLRRTVRLHLNPSSAARHHNLVRVRRIVVREPVPGAAEVAVILERDESVWAMALRLEHTRKPAPGHTTWQTTVMTVL